MQSHFTQLRAVLVELKFLATGLSEERVVVIACFLANEKRGFFLFLRLGHFSYKRSTWEQNSGSKSQPTPAFQATAGRHRAPDYGVEVRLPLPRIYKLAKVAENTGHELQSSRILG